MATIPNKPNFFSRRIVLGATVGSAVVFFIAGVIFWGGFNTAMEATNNLEFCISCHEMKDNVYKEYKPTIHYSNRTGVRATCSDCHVPDPWIHKMVRKIQASNEVYHKILGTVDTPEKFDEHRLTMAKRVWKSMKQTDSRECRNCHNLESMNPEYQRPRARKQHLNAMKNGQTCIDCHKGIAHKSVRKLLADEELEALEKPWPIYVREVPEIYKEGLKRVEAKEAELAAKAAAEKEKAKKAKLAAKEAEKARIKQAVESALEKYKAEHVASAATAQPAVAAGEKTAPSPVSAPKPAAAKGGDVGGGVDWSAAPDRTISLLYPGETSIEWVLNGRDHGGARPFEKGGDRCTTCHDKEIADMGKKMVTGEKAESTPMPDKRAHIDVKVQAAHKDGFMFLRFEWEKGDHVPVPFVDGGKMDPKNPMKLAVMLSYDREENGVEFSERAGCWQTCHHDARKMPDAPDQAALDGAGDLGIDVKGGVTKYLKESRTKIEVKGRRGKKRGGWDKMKEKAELDAAMQAGQFMDLLRYKSGTGETEDGHILEQRVMSGGIGLEASAKEDGGNWVVVMKRALKSDKPGDVTIESGKLYNFGFAIHDDHTDGRYHHVSLGYKLGLDNGDAEVNVQGQ